ncbi:MAG TPA: 50S ribosomal protein L9 [Bacteroidetes bacterium]|nr:50S ribosomal protein L9 [Bacteroidota bacterium]
MKVILLKDMEKLGSKYDVATVKDGYGRNFLIPRKFAVIANKTNMNKLQSLKAAEEKKMAAMLEEFKKQAESIESKVFEIGAKAGTTDKIFGSVTNVQLANKLKEDLGIDLDRKIIEIEEEVKTLGTHKALVKLHKDVVATMTFEVIKE